MEYNTLPDPRGDRNNLSQKNPFWGLEDTCQQKNFHEFSISWYGCGCVVKYWLTEYKLLHTGSTCCKSNEYWVTNLHMQAWKSIKYSLQITSKTQTTDNFFWVSRENTTIWSKLWLKLWKHAQTSAKWVRPRFFNDKCCHKFVRTANLRTILNFREPLNN
jgi:hypothetical protein